MSERLLIPKVQPDQRGAAGWYLWRGRARLVCGGCGRDAGDLRDHSIDEDGTVNASILCPDAGCGWHVWGRLQGWSHGRKPAGVAVVDGGGDE